MNNVFGVTYVNLVLADGDRDIVGLETGVEHSHDLLVGLASSLSSLVGTLEDDLAANLVARVGGVTDGQGREGLEGELGVGSKASDELSGQGEDLVEVLRGIEGGREGLLAEGGADVRGVAGLDGQDGAGSSQVVLVGDGGSGAEVGGNTNALEDTGETNEGVDISHGEGKGGLPDGLVSESSGEELDVSLFTMVSIRKDRRYLSIRSSHLLILVDPHQVGVELLVEAGIAEVGLGEFLNTLHVELALKKLQSKGVVENGDIATRGSGDGSLLQGSTKGGCGETGHEAK